jgi:ABC-type uncharacterized transport system permease subunit
VSDRRFKIFVGLNAVMVVGGLLLAWVGTSSLQPWLGLLIAALAVTQIAVAVRSRDRPNSPN